MIFIILRYRFIYQFYCLPTLFDKEPNNITSLQEYIQLVEEWILFYNTARIKGKKKQKRKTYTKREK